MVLSLKQTNTKKGQSLIELLVVIALLAMILPPLILTLLASKDGKVQQQKRLKATAILKESQEALRVIREGGWSSISSPGTFHILPTSSSWNLTAGTEVTDGFIKRIDIANVNRNNGQIVSSGGTYDPSTKKITVNISWSEPVPSSISSTFYLTRYLENGLYTQTTQADFQTGITSNVQITNTAGGEVTLGNNTKAKWCSPEFSVSTIDLPDGPPVAVSAYASPTSSSIPNDVFVATSPITTSSIKMAYVNVSANADPPVSTLHGIFTLNPSEYSSSGLVPSGIGLDNNFITRDIKYYKAASGNMYALIATNRPDKEIIAIQIKSGGADAWQDSTKKIYKYWTYFNTRMYQGNSTSQPNQDYSPYGYGVSSLAILGDKGYATSGGYLYVFNLANIDSKSSSSALDMIGCRIELDGYDCNPSTNKIRKYSSGSTGSSWDTEQTGQTGCMDGGAVSPYADTHIYPIQVGSNTYVYIAVGAGADPELNIANVTTVPTSSTSPKISNANCGTISAGNAAWKRVGQYDFNSKSGTQESANSVYAKSDGTRAYISSNGGVDANNDGQPDSYQFYIINTTNKSSPAFLSGSSSTGAQSGYYSGNSTNIQMFPRRSLTVLNGQRAVIVGQDGFSDSTNPLDYQVLNIDSEVSPSFCGGIEFDSGFNDLTSVIEADADTFVYMVANTNEKQLKIIQGGPDGTYNASGVYESAAFNGSYARAFNRFYTNFSQPTNTTINFQIGIADPNPATGSCNTATFTFAGPDGSTASYFTGNSPIFFDDDNSNYENPAQCMKYKAFFSTTDYNATPVLNDISINYSP